MSVFLRYAIAIGSLTKYEGTQKCVGGKIEMGYKYKVRVVMCVGGKVRWCDM